MGWSKIDQKGIRPLQDKLMTITELKPPNNEKELKSFLEPSSICPNTSIIYQHKRTA